jgi:hypothetical protein
MGSREHAAAGAAAGAAGGLLFGGPFTRFRPVCT